MAALQQQSQGGGHTPQPPSQLISLDNRPLAFDGSNVLAYEEETENFIYKTCVIPVENSDAP